MLHLIHIIIILQELLKVVYVDKELAFIKDLDISRPTEQKQEITSYDGKNGVRCIRISSDGKHLASGDRSGNMFVFPCLTTNSAIYILFF